MSKLARVSGLRFRHLAIEHHRHATTPSAPQTSAALDEWVAREARPISLRQLTVFGRSLTEARLLSSANYVREELPTRIAHRLRDMQTLPYNVLTNSHLSHVYDLYHSAFDILRRVPPISSTNNNEHLCAVIRSTLVEHLTVIPRLVMGVIECQDRLPAERMDALMTTLLRSRISRRVIAEQHLALTSTFHARRNTPTSPAIDTQDIPIGHVFLHTHASTLLTHIANTVTSLSRQIYGPSVLLPEVKIHGHTTATLTYIPSHLEYVLGELLRNSVQAVVENDIDQDKPAPIDVLICENAESVIFRVSDQGGGVRKDLLPHLWSFVSGPRRKMRLENLQQTPQLSATLQELQVPSPDSPSSEEKMPDSAEEGVASRPPNLRLGIGLPMARVYAEYWAGKLEVHSMQGYGVDAVFEVCKLGNRDERIMGRAVVDGL